MTTPPPLTEEQRNAIKTLTAAFRIFVETCENAGSIEGIKTLSEASVDFHMPEESKAIEDLSLRFTKLGIM